MAFVVALNIAARVNQPHVYVVQGVALRETEWETKRAPGSALNPRPPVTTLTPQLIVQETEEQVYAENLNHLRNWSLIAVAGLVFASGVGGYMVSGMLLRPVRDITRVASEIGATNLSRRINHQGVEDEMKALADTFDLMIGRLEDAFESQRRFVQDASHELRTPLAAIRTNIEVTEMDPESSVEDYRDLMETVKTQTERLTRLSDDLLLLTSTRNGEPEFETVDVEHVAREVVRQLAPVASQKSVHIRLRADPAPNALANADLLFRCVFNLVDNAVKYGGHGSEVTVAIEANGRDVSVAVKDTGPGIPPEALGHVFDRFYRVDRGRSRREGGSGLGLAIVKELVEKMNGSVSVHSEPATGSTFTLRLPASPLTAEQEEGAPMAAIPHLRAT